MEQDKSKSLMRSNVGLDEHAGSFCVATEGLSMDRRRRWKFILKEDGSWAWSVSKPDGTQESSDRSFRKLTECTADAVTHGYVVWNEEERRDSELRWQQCLQFTER